MGGVVVGRDRRGEDEWEGEQVQNQEQDRVGPDDGATPEDGEEFDTEVPPTPDVAGQVFGERLDLAVRFVGHLADTGVSHGLIGPREVPRLWGRHVLNCAVLAEHLDRDSTVVDIGSGAGLPGIAIALARPDLTVVLIEPLLRRTAWLGTVVSDLGLTGVEVVRGRAEEVTPRGADHLTARAVARLDKLGRWAAPHLRSGGTLVALKGSSAGEEVEATRKALAKAGLLDPVVLTAGAGLLEEPSTVVRARRR